MKTACKVSYLRNKIDTFITRISIYLFLYCIFPPHRFFFLNTTRSVVLHVISCCHDTLVCAFYAWNHLISCCCSMFFSTASMFGNLTHRTVDHNSSTSTVYCFPFHRLHGCNKCKLRGRFLPIKSIKSS
jgi:hypothetical protein